MRIVVTCPFPPTPNKNFHGEQQKRNRRKPFHHVAKESLFFPFFFSFAFASLFPFSFVLFAKGVRCRAFTKRSRRKARAICSQTVFQIRNSYTELGIIRTSAEPTAWHPIYRLPTFRALVQRYQFEWCRLRLFLHA